MSVTEPGRPGIDPAAAAAAEEEARKQAEQQGSSVLGDVVEVAADVVDLAGTVVEGVASVAGTVVGGHRLRNRRFARHLMRRIRPAREDEAELLAGIVAGAYAPWIPVIGQRPGPMHDDYAARIAAGEAHVLEDETGRVVGLVVIERAADHLMLDNIAVAPDRAGRGDGRLLLDFVEAEARRLGLPEIRLYTHALMAKNIAIYAKRGYVVTDRRMDKGFDRVFMAKRISDSAATAPR